MPRDQPQLGSFPNPRRVGKVLDTKLFFLSKLVMLLSTKIFLCTWITLESMFVNQKVVN